MLALDTKVAKHIGEFYQIAVDGKKKPVYAIVSNYLKCKPCIMPDRPDKLLRRSDWMQVIKKYRLSNADVKKLRSTWTLGAPSFESQNPRAMFAFKEMEELLLKRMRANYNPGRGDLMPWFAMAENNNSPDNMFIVGNTSCGKTTFLNKMLTNLNKQGENWATGRPVDPREGLHEHAAINGQLLWTYYPQAIGLPLLEGHQGLGIFQEKTIPHHIGYVGCQIRSFIQLDFNVGDVRPHIHPVEAVAIVFIHFAPDYNKAGYLVNPDTRNGSHGGLERIGQCERPVPVGVPLLHCYSGVIKVVVPEGLELGIVQVVDG